MISKKHIFTNVFSILSLFSILFVRHSVVINVVNFMPKDATSLIQINFLPSSEDFANPERGFMKQSNIWVDQPLDKKKIVAKEPSDTVVWIYFHLENYRDPRDGKGVTLNDYQGKLLEPIGSGIGLDTVKDAFTEARIKGLKLVIRFLYVGYPGIGSTSDPNQTEPDMPLDWVLQHINQLKPLIIDNVDVIAAVQVGFVGYWGEWHSTKYLGALESRKKIVDTLLTTVPKDRMLMIRYPRYKQLWYGGPLTDPQSYSQTDVARIGLHDDAFLRDEDDGGTYKSSTTGIKISNYCDNYPGSEIQCWQDYVNIDSRFTPVGGEASRDNPPRTSCPNTLAQMANMHWSLINNGFNKTVHDRWISEGCMPDIRRRLGYRFVLSKLIIPSQAIPGETIPFHLELENIGFAAPYNYRPVIVVLKENTTGTVREIPLTSVDSRRWLPGSVITIDQSVVIPTNTPAGIYSTYLWIPDAYHSLRTRPEYAIRLANQNVWQPGTGFNLLFNNLVVSGASTKVFIPYLLKHP